MIFMKISQNFIKSHLKFWLISQISFHKFYAKISNLTLSSYFQHFQVHKMLVSSETSYLGKLSLVLALSNKGITMVLIRLQGCAGLSAPLFTNHKRQIITQQGPIESL